MKKILIFLSLIIALGVGLVMAYDITPNDDELLDRVENKLIQVIDADNSVTAEIVVNYIYKILDTRENLSERHITLFEIIADDISWEYEIGEYAQVDDDYEYFEAGDNYDDEINYEAGEFTGQEDDLAEVIASYKISGDTIRLESGRDDIKNQEVWNIFAALIPASVRADFARFEISHSSESDTAAHVEQTPEDNTKWLLNVNLDSFYTNGVLEPAESYATLIHEFSHVMTLSKSQVRYTPETDNEVLLERFENGCEGNFLQEGCLNTDAYFNNFINTFWADKAYLEKVRNEEISAYADTPESFITEYAATNPGEDIAESFTYFVLRASPEGNTIADQKLRFFYQYRELESLRKQIRSNLAALK